MAKTNFQTVDDYLAALPPHARPLLDRVRATIKKALPRASEEISYQIPVYKLDGVMVLYFAGYAKHYSIYPATDRLLESLGADAEGLLHHKATLRFPADEPVPTRLIARIAKLRAEEATRTATAKKNKRAQRSQAELEPAPRGGLTTDEVPGDLARALKRKSKASASWKKLAPSVRRGYVKNILGAKKPETRARRIDQIVETLSRGVPARRTGTPPAARAKK